MKPSEPKGLDIEDNSNKMPYRFNNWFAFTDFKIHHWLHYTTNIKYLYHCSDKGRLTHIFYLPYPSTSKLAVETLP